MALNPQDIARVAHLARLELRPDETERVLGQLNGFFALVAQMDAVNTDGVEPLAHPAAVLGDVALRLRDDIASEPNQRDISQVSAPAGEPIPRSAADRGYQTRRSCDALVGAGLPERGWRRRARVDCGRGCHHRQRWNES